MAKWFYYNESGEKIEVTGGQLKGLAKAGMITPDTLVETEEGKSAPARKVKGLTFVAAAQPKTVAPKSATPEVEISGLSQTIPLVKENMSTASIPEEINPFAAAPSPQSTVPTVDPATPKSVHVPLIEKKNNIPSPLTIGIVIACVVFAVGGIGIGLMIGSGNNSVAVAPWAKQNARLELKEPPEEAIFIRVMRESNMGRNFQRHLDNQNRGAGGRLLEALLSAFLVDARLAFVRFGEAEDKDILTKMSVLQRGYDDGMQTIVGRWDATIQHDWYPNANTTLSLLVLSNEVSGLNHNLEQMLFSIRESIRPLDRARYANTVKLYSILAQYHEAVTNPSGSYNSYTNNRRTLRDEFTRTMSLAELEW